MENKSNITDHATLIQRISQLKEDKKIQERALKHSANIAFNSLNPLNMLKQSLHGFVEDKDVKSDLLKAGVTLGANFLIDKSLGKYRNIKGFLSSVLVESISTPLIYSGLSRLFPKYENEEAQEEESENSIR
jgi:hypothetical protein